MKNWCGKKKMNSSSAAAETDEELEIPLLENTNPRPIKNYTGCACCDRLMLPLTIASFFYVLILFVIPMIAERWNFTTDKPEIRLESLFYCPTSTSENLVILDLNFQFENPNYHSDICIHPFEVSIYHHQHNFLTKMSPLPPTWVDPGDHTSVKLFADVSLLDHPIHETIRFDLKIHALFRFIDLPYRAHYAVDLVCEDVKVALLASNNSLSSCASMVGDPFTCSYV